jgi:hypothetical protein
LPNGTPPRPNLIGANAEPAAAMLRKFCLDDVVMVRYPGDICCNCGNVWDPKIAHYADLVLTDSSETLFVGPFRQLRPFAGTWCSEVFDRAVLSVADAIAPH